MSTMQRVRQAISLSHDTIETTDFAKSLMDGRITRQAYGVYLAQIAKIHAVLEQSVADCREIAAYFQPSMIRTPAIARDATALGQDLKGIEILHQTEEIVKQIRVWRESTPYAVLGCLYILEGSRMGSMMIGRALLKVLKLDAASTPNQRLRGDASELTVPGVEYHLEDVANTPRRVKEFKAAIDSAQLNGQSEQELTMGACIFMQLLLELYRVLPVSIAQQQSDGARCPIAHGNSAPSLPTVNIPNLRSA